MKTRVLIITVISTMLGSICPAETAPTSDAFYRQAVAAEKAGDPDAARVAYEQALRLNPHNADARFRLGQLKHRRDAIARHGRQSVFNAVMLPEIRLDDANLRESLDLLAKMIETQSEGKVAPNFIIQDTDGVLADAKISMQLRNVTSGAVLEYILGMVKARARHDEFAIVILPM
ncbi:MAG: tetratricopeptide repeat protein [Luteolibacter sp.]